MTSALRIFAAWITLIIVTLGITSLLALGVAFAQDAVATIAEPPGGIEATIVMVRDSLIAGVIALVGGILAWVQAKLPAWLRSRIDLNETLDSVQWEDYLRSALGNGITHARTVLKMDPADIKTWEQKSAFLQVASAFLGRFHGDIGAYFDKDKNGVPDLLEVAIARMAPATMAIRPAKDDIGDVIEPRTSPKRVDDAVVERLAAKLVRRPKGAVTQ